MQEYVRMYVYRPQLNNIPAKRAGLPSVHSLRHGRECACVSVCMCKSMYVYVG